MNSFVAFLVFVSLLLCGTSTAFVASSHDQRHLVNTKQSWSGNWTTGSDGKLLGKLIFDHALEFYENQYYLDAYQSPDSYFIINPHLRKVLKPSKLVELKLEMETNPRGFVDAEFKADCRLSCHKGSTQVHSYWADKATTSQSDRFVVPIVFNPERCEAGSSMRLNCQMEVKLNYF